MNDAIKKVCANAFEIDPEEFSLKTRKVPYVMARASYYYFHKKYVNNSISLKKLGEIIRPEEPFDHSTIISALKNVEDWVMYDKKYKRLFEKIDNELSSIFEKGLPRQEVEKTIKKEEKMNYYDKKISIILNEKNTFDCIIDYRVDEFGNLLNESILIKEIIHLQKDIFYHIDMTKIDKEYIKKFKEEIIIQLSL